MQIANINAATEVRYKVGVERFQQIVKDQEAYIEKWLLDYCFDLDIINIALKKTTSKANPNFDYLDKLLTDWHDRNFKTVAEIEEFLSNLKQKSKNIKELEKKTNYNNYQKRNYDNLNDLYANKKAK